ncbi:MAG: hypothetical protein AB2L09_07385 [Coriobacteriia bacterium]
MLDTSLNGMISKETYTAKAQELENKRATFELRLKELKSETESVSAQVEASARTASSAHIQFEAADFGLQRKVLASVLCNFELGGGHIAFYQEKGPLGFLERNPEVALIHEWWAYQKLTQTNGLPC